LEYALPLLAILVIALMASLRGVERRLAHIQADQAKLMRHLGMAASTDPSAEVRELARDPRRRIEAIRLYREQSGMELREAKAVVEALAAQQG